MALLLTLLLALPLVAFAAEHGKVVKVSDGDTIHVQIGDQVEKVRLIGIDTPETHHPTKGVEYFGTEAAAFTKRMANGKKVRLKDDPECSNRDRYGRLLRYVYLPDGRMLNALIISKGYGFAYVKYPFSRMEKFRKLQKKAEREGRGLWAEEPSSARR